VRNDTDCRGSVLSRARGYHLEEPHCRVEAGCELERHGARHDVYVNPATGQKQAVARHTEIDNVLARHIKKSLGLKG
jgi:mRNA interferase HicA